MMCTQRFSFYRESFFHTLKHMMLKQTGALRVWTNYCSVFSLLRHQMWSGLQQLCMAHVFILHLKTL